MRVQQNVPRMLAIGLSKHFALWSITWVVNSNMPDDSPEILNNCITVCWLRLKSWFNTFFLLSWFSLLICLLVYLILRPLNCVLSYNLIEIIIILTKYWGQTIPLQNFQIQILFYFCTNDWKMRNCCCYDDTCFRIDLLSRILIAVSVWGKLHFSWLEHAFHW